MKMIQLSSLSVYCILNSILTLSTVQIPFPLNTRLNDEIKNGERSFNSFQTSFMLTVDIDCLVIHRYLNARILDCRISLCIFTIHSITAFSSPCFGKCHSLLLDGVNGWTIWTNIHVYIYFLYVFVCRRLYFIFSLEHKLNRYVLYNTLDSL